MVFPKNKPKKMFFEEHKPGVNKWDFSVRMYKEWKQQ